MKEFSGKVAVITGAASGIGFGIAERCVRGGMKVVLADIEASALTKAEKELKTKGADVLSVVTDVSKADDVETLAKETLDTYGAVHLLVNNAGVVAGTTIWESTASEWEWVLGVNLWGIINGLRTFVPMMLKQDTEAHIVNTASATGLVSYGLSAPYQVAKHGVVSLSEHLYYSLQQRNAKISVSVLCSAWVKTRILNAGRNRPDGLRNVARKRLSGENSVAHHVKKLRRAVQEGMSPEEVADQVFNAIENEQFYILTHPTQTTPLVQQRLDGILHQRNPLQIDIDDFLFLRR
jgi:NAD(P)-dependent dehydrogenase (short-subunit alcohol dehydrogenase family)